jgi:hypothetical protein
MNKILVVKDTSENHKIPHKLLPNMPFRSIILAKSGQGKTNLLVNLLTRPEFYGKKFEPDNIYIVSPSIKNDDKLKKMIEFLEIPEYNLYEDYDEQAIRELYKMIDENYQENPKTHSLIIFDDVGFSGDLKASSKNNMIDKIFCNSRHIGLSTYALVQRITQINLVCRNNANSIYVFDTDNKNLKIIEEENNFLGNKASFMDMFRKNIDKKSDFILIDYTKDKKEMYKDKNFNILF